MANIFDDIQEDTTLPEDVDYLAELVGEGKKFADHSALARGKAESDRYIDLLKKQLEEANKELNTRTSLDSFLDQMKQPRTPVEPQTPVTPPSTPQSQELDDSELEKRLEQLLARREAAKATETNAERVKRVLADQLGSNQATFIKQKSQELQLSPEQLSEFATRSPAAFFRLVGIEETSNQVGTSVPRGLNTPGRDSQPIKNKAYFEKMKATNPKQYRDPKTTGEMMRSMAELEKRGIPWE